MTTKRSLTLVLTLIVVFGACVWSQAASYKVGSFVKTTATTPAAQVVAHGLAQTPKAILLWSAHKTNESISPNYFYGFGATDGTTSMTTGAASLDAGKKGQSQRRVAPKILTIADHKTTPHAEADFVSWDATNFTISWTINDTVASVIHFIAIGGSQVSAKVLGWNMASGATGNQAVTGVGFQPSVVIHSHAGAAYTSSPPASQKHAVIGMGAMDSDGNQWANAYLTLDNSFSSDTQRYQRTSKTIAAITSAQTVAKEAEFVSMDADGFTVNWTTIDGSASSMFSIALAGVKARVGSFNKSTSSAPTAQAITGLGMKPGLVLLTSTQSVSGTAVPAHSRFGIGASNLTVEGSSANQDTDALADTSVDAVDKTSKVFVKIDNNTPNIDAEADMTSFDGDGFTVTWTTNDSIATEILYLALASRDRRLLFFH